MVKVKYDSILGELREEDIGTGSGGGDSYFKKVGNVISPITNGDNLSIPNATIFSDVEKFNTILTNPVWQEGKLFYDMGKKALSYYNENSEITVNLGQEMLIRVFNSTGSDIQNGTIVYPAGTSGDDILVGLADANTYEKCRVVGLSTTLIPNNGYGYVTKSGEVGGVNTGSYSSESILYLDPEIPGGMTDIRPDDGHFLVIIGAVKKVDPINGSILVDTVSSQYTVETLQNVGWSRTYGNATLSFDNSSRTLTINPTNFEFHFYQKGVKYSKTTDSYQIPDVEGSYYLYYNNGSIQHIHKPNLGQIDSVIRNNPTIAFIYWNSIDKKAEYIGYELHDFNNPPLMHAYNHFSYGTRYLTGISPNILNVDASGNISSDAQFGIDGGAIVDEDIYLPNPSISSTTGLSILYLSGSTTDPLLRSTTNSGFSILNTGTGRLAYNTISTGSYILSEIVNNNFMLCHIFAINENNPTKRIVSVIGQNQYNTISSARDGATTEIKNLVTAGLFPQETKAIATIIFQSSDSYGNSVKARTRSISATENFIDWRTVYFNGSSGGISGGGGSTSLYNDSLFRVFNNIDSTKQIAFDASSIGTGSTKTITVLNNTSLSGTNTGDQSFITLGDTPNSYLGKSGYFPTVKSTEDSLEFSSDLNMGLLQFKTQNQPSTPITDYISVYYNTSGTTPNKICKWSYIDETGTEIIVNSRKI